jgi:hypothetical protein
MHKNSSLLALLSSFFPPETFVISIKDFYDKGSEQCRQYSFGYWPQKAQKKPTKITK